MQGTRMIVTCGHDRDTERLKEELIECGAQVSRSFELIAGVAAGMTPDALKRFFSRYPDAEVIPDRRRQIPPMPFRIDEWTDEERKRLKPASDNAPVRTDSPLPSTVSPLALFLMKVDDVHKGGIDGSGVRVCMIDSGVDLDHPDLKGTFATDKDGNPLVADFTETDLKDTVGHGTAVAGSITAQGRQLYTIRDETTGRPLVETRIKGIAPGARVMSAKVFDARVSSGYDSSIIAAMEWAAANGAQIINMSLGGSALPNDGKDSLAAAVTALQNRGILVVTAAGNEGGGWGSLQSPGSSPGALTVGAGSMYRSLAEIGFLAQQDHWTVDQLAAFSSQGPTADGRMKPDIMAPGAYDWGLAPTQGSQEGQTYQLFGGTSQASPLTAGVAALVYQAYFHAHKQYPSPQEFMRIICSTADDLGLLPYMQGTGRVNALKAVQAAGQQLDQLVFEPVSPALACPGHDTPLFVALTNPGKTPLHVSVSPTYYGQAEQDESFSGELMRDESPQPVLFEVESGVDLLHVSLNWMTSDYTAQSPRMMVALYDPEGSFVNYQVPNSSGDIELGKSVDTWVARPMPGTWRANVYLRLGTKETKQSYTLTVQRYRRQVWDWVEAAENAIRLEPGERRQLTLTVRVPANTPAGTYAGQLTAGSLPIPLSVVVPIHLQRGRGIFAGSFQHGYQGSWGNGDWFYHELTVPEETPSLMASIQWPDLDNALELYLIDPHGAAVMGRSNMKDVMQGSGNRELGSQFLFAHPEPGVWRLLIHSFAFCGRSLPEPYWGQVETAGDLVSPRSIQLRVKHGTEAPAAFTARNPGQQPITLQATGQSSQVGLIWRNVAAELKPGVTPDGKAQGEGYVTLGTVKVPVGARQMGVVLSWDQPDTTVTVSLYDPVSENDRTTAVAKDGFVSALESAPVPGEWTVIAGITDQPGDARPIHLKGAMFIVAPQVLESITAEPVTIQPGGQALVPLTVKLPPGTDQLAGQIVVTTTRGDRMGEIPFHIQTDK